MYILSLVRLILCEMDEDKPSLEEQIKLAGEYFELKNKVLKKRSIENISSFGDAEREKKKQSEIIYTDFMDIVCVINQLDAEISRAEIHNNSKESGDEKTWQRTNQENFINKLKLVRNGKHRYSDRDE